ncbi:hypothetical protein J6590_014804 [Homalodisca vitripennis]|nr:hypothetical protein J6590_014804 [Homalodisca vitripennis]
MIIVVSVALFLSFHQSERNEQGTGTRQSVPTGHFCQELSNHRPAVGDRQTPKSIVIFFESRGTFVRCSSDLTALVRTTRRHDFGDEWASGDTEQRHVCECGRSYKYRSGLLQHRRLECGLDPRFSCQMCSYKTKRKTSLKYHVFLKHKARL